MVSAIYDGRPQREPGRSVLVTRPEPGASETARRLRDAGWLPLLAPMLAIEPRAARLPDPQHIQAVLVTSAAVLTLLPAVFHLTPLLAVGDASAAAAVGAGFRHVASAGADADALCALALRTRDPGGGPLLLPVAAGQGHALAAALRRAGFAVHRRALYRARPVRTLPADAAEALAAGRVDAALFFSPATGRAFVRTIRPRAHGIVANADAIVISAATAEAIAPLPWRRIRVATRPTQEQLLALLHERLNEAEQFRLER